MGERPTITEETLPDDKDVEYAAEFERHQFNLYDARRLAAENQATALSAAGLAVGALVTADYSRPGHPSVGWFIGALAGLGWVILVANLARFVSHKTPRCLGGKVWKRETPPPSENVDACLGAVRDAQPDSRQYRTLVHELWRARADSAFKLGKLKDMRLRASLIGFLGPILYFAMRVL